jgi:hypothetical protein
MHFLEVYRQAIWRLSDCNIKTHDQAQAAVPKYTKVPRM